MEPEGSLPHSQEPEKTGSRLCVVFRNMVIFYGEALLAPRLTPKLEDHPLSAVPDCIFAATLHIRRPFLHPQPEDAPCRGDRDPLIIIYIIYNHTYHTFSYHALIRWKTDRIKDSEPNSHKYILKFKCSPNIIMMIFVYDFNL
jgi:hypothetical protein